MDPVAAQYEAYPYPERDPADEAKRLVRGSPSDPAEIDHYLFGGLRDWSQPFRALVAGGGTGDGAIMLAQLLADAKCPAEVVHLDRSQAARRIAEARAAARGLGNLRFVTADLAEAPALGPFDYVDCCGVLHHLPDPQAGFDALAQAIAPGGGMGAMVYAPYGRTGVYPLQHALAALTEGMAPAEKVEAAKAVLAALPASNWFARNDLLADHRQSDAALYDLLLHARDTPFTSDEVMAAVAAAGLDFVSFVEPARYDPATWAPPELAARAAALPAPARAALAEKLAGGIRTHVFYAGKGAPGLAKIGPALRPRLRGGATAAALAAAAAQGRAINAVADGAKRRAALPRSAAPILKLMDGRRRLGEIAQTLGRDWIAFAADYGPLHRTLTGHGLLLCSEVFA
ncbi:MAG: class I SAM-dependent methyltransferase [Rubrimonas sp.]|uniref:class I SAM-dependent methyltransferase n=1 Tax=Rubrimonas sp. TaxID=2036015 RepID=UPI002FDE5E87